MSHPAVWPSVTCHGVGTLIAIISQLSTLPACAPVNASMAASRLATHDSGSGWLAMPFLCDSFIHYSTPVLSRRTTRTVRRFLFKGKVQCHVRRFSPIQEPCRHTMVLHKSKPASHVLVRGESLDILVSLLLEAKKQFADFRFPFEMIISAAGARRHVLLHRTVERCTEKPLGVALPPEAP